MWILSHVYGGRTFQVLVNDRTSEVIGERPYSRGKITIAVLVAVVAAVALIAAIGVARG